MLNAVSVKRTTLNGKVKVSGAKNSALKLLAASLLTSGQVKLDNFPCGLLDTKVMIDMLRQLGKEVTTFGSTVEISEREFLKTDLRWKDRSVRTSLLLLGALVARFGHASVPLPGGCKLGERGIDLHIHVLESLGAKVWEADGMLHAKAQGGLQGTDIHLRIRSTGATENAILAATGASGVTRVWNPHIRPEILNLIEMLRLMGAVIRVNGQESIEIEGGHSLTGVRHTVIPDNMEAITWLIGAAMTGGEVEIEDFPFDDLEVPLIHLRESGVRFYRGDRSVIVRAEKPLPFEISTGPYPAINSDMQPLFAAYACCAFGVSKIVDLRFLERFAYAEQFQRLGVDIEVNENMAVVSGKGSRSLKGAEVTASDLRAGMALLLLGMVCDGVTTVNNAWQIERGYESFISKMRALGANVDEVNLADG